MSFYIHNSLNYKVISNLCIVCVDIESLSVEIKSIIHLTLLKSFTESLKVKLNNLKLFQTNFFPEQSPNKNIHIACSFSLNILEHELNLKVPELSNIMCRNDMVPTIDKTIRATRKTMTDVDYILIEYFVNKSFITVIFN